jgi:hypothetical protein
MAPHQRPIPPSPPSTTHSRFSRPTYSPLFSPHLATRVAPTVGRTCAAISKRPPRPIVGALAYEANPPRLARLRRTEIRPCHAMLDSSAQPAESRCHPRISRVPAAAFACKTKSCPPDQSMSGQI